RQRRDKGVGSLITKIYSLGIPVSKHEVGDAWGTQARLGEIRTAIGKRTQIGVDSKRGQNLAATTGCHWASGAGQPRDSQIVTGHDIFPSGQIYAPAGFSHSFRL